MALNVVTLVVDLGDGQDNYLTSGVATLVPSVVLTDSADHLIAGLTPINVAFHPSGAPQIKLIATDNSGVLPSGWAWTITPPASSGIAPFSFFLPYSGGSTQYLSALAPVSSTPVLVPWPPRAATLVVAASDASTSWKAAADYVCTGTADNVKINAALAALPAHGGTVLLSDGTFTISAPIIPTVNNARLLGQGPQATVIQAGAGANCNGYQYDSTAQAYNLIFCAIEGMTFNGGYNSGAGNTAGYGCYINYFNSTHTFWDFYLRDVWFENWAQDGFRSTCGHGYVLDHVLSEYNGGNGINFAGGFTDSPPRIFNGTVKINNGSGIIVNCIDTVVRDMEISTCTGSYGLLISASGVKAAGNQIKNNSGSGVYITGGSEGVELTGNTISFSGQHGLLLDDANCTVVGNFFLNNSFSGSGGTTGAADEINIAHGTFSAAGNQIVGNIFDCGSSSRYGINFGTASDTAGVIAANRIVNPVTAAINTVPSDTLIIGSGNIALGGAKVTGMGNGSAATDGAAFGQIPLADSTAAHILALGTQAAGANGKWADSAHVHPADAWVAADNNLLVASTPVDSVQGSATLIAGTLYLAKLTIRSALTITNLWWGVNTAGSGASTGSFTGLYNSSGTLLTGSPDIAASINVSNGPKSIAVTTPQALSAGTFVWAAILVNLASTQPLMWRSVSDARIGNINLSAASYRFAANGTGLTSLPSSITPSSNGQSTAFTLAVWGS